MKRPFAVTFLGCLFIVVGLANSIFFLSKSPFDRWTLPLSLIGIIAIVAGVFLLKGCNWARWLMLAWLAFHVVVSALNSLSGSVVHLVLLVAIAYFLLTPPDSRYFSSAPLK
jgi:uncharacterized membrane protein